MQSQPEKYTKGVLAAAKDIVATEGAAFLLSGFGRQVKMIIPKADSNNYSGF